MATKQKPKKTTTPKKTSEIRTGKRLRKLAEHRSFKLTKERIKQPEPLPGVIKLFNEPIKLIKNNKLLFFWLTLVYSVLLLVLTKGLGSAFDIVDTKKEVVEFLGDDGKNIDTSFALFSYLLSSFNGQVTDVSGTYQMFITLIVVLGTIWLARQLLSGEKPTLRDGFYKGMYPLVPFLLILVVISVQLLPALIGNFIFTTVISQGLAITFLEKFLWFMLFFGTLILSLYMVLSSIFALNIVTLPNVRPMQALRSARELVIHRRIGIFARILVLPILGFAVAFLVFIPLIMFVPVIVEPLFLLLSCFGIIFATVYMYNFYRQLL